MKVREYFKSGEAWVWMNAGAVTICLIMVVGLLGLVAVRGLGHFWPADVLQAQALLERTGPDLRSSIQGTLAQRESAHADLASADQAVGSSWAPISFKFELENMVRCSVPV